MMSHAACHKRTVLLPVSRWRAARRVLPWAGLFLLTGTLAHAADQALGHASLDESAIYASVPAEASMRWILLSSGDEQGQLRSATCLMPVDRVAADVLDVPSVDFDTTVGELCLTPRSTAEVSAVFEDLDERVRGSGSAGSANRDP
ncbi:MAG: hypothetical protein JO023_18560 [Chloroflexi bacterium]|nr:hypothetical protein [Chloroflexota bacterium]